MAVKSKQPRSELRIFKPEKVSEVMKVTMTKIAAGPCGVARTGTVLDVKEGEGKELVEGQFARAFDAQRDAKAKRGWTKASDEQK